MKKLILILFILSGACSFTSAQEMHCMLFRIPEQQLLNSSKLIVRAEITSRESFWNDSKTKIFTKHQLQVFEVLKGKCSQSITLITEGGSVKDISVEFSDRIDLMVGEQVVLMLQDVPKYWKGLPRLYESYSCWASLQSVFRINPKNERISDIFKSYYDLTTLRNAVYEATQQTPKFYYQPQFQIPPQGNSGIAATVSSLSPTTITAGNKSILTITGSGFGATRGNGFVEFYSAVDDGSFGKPYIKEYVSWTDTEIKVYVPSSLIGFDSNHSAATGPVKVTPDGGVAAQSAGNITVRYSLLNLPNLDSAYVMRAGSFNGSGGYTLQYNSQFLTTFGSEARATFERALTKWKCATGFNWSINSTTTTVRAALDDNVNVISDDVNDPLPSNVGGRGTNYLRQCGNGTLAKVITIGQDIIFNDVPSTYTFNFGIGNPTISQVDFETVCLHELGHLHQLSHTLKTSSEVMASTVFVGQAKKDLLANDIAGGQEVMTRSAISVGCNTPAHSALAMSITISTSTTFPICSNGSAVFSATSSGLTSNSAYVWRVNGVEQTSASGSSSFTYNNPVNNASITCSVRGCSSTISNSITVLVSTLPAATISYASPFCKSLTTAQSVSRTGTTGGVYTSSPAGLSINSSTGAITPSTSTAGTYTVTYTMTATAPCPNTTASTTVTITAQPNATLNYSSTSFCKSITTAVSPALPGSSNGVYSSSPTLTGLNASTGSFIPSACTAGNYTITYTIAAAGGCTASSASQTITIVNQLATPTAISGITSNSCGTSKTFSITAIAGASSYQWTIPTGVTVVGSSTGTSITLSFPSNFTSGSLGVRAIASNGCNSNVYSVVLSGPPAQPGTITVSNINTSTRTATATIAAVTGATSYTWSGTGGTIVSGQGTRTITAKQNVGAIALTLCVVANNSCGSSPSRCISFNAGTVAFDSEEITKNLINESQAQLRTTPSIFPNPASNFIQVKFENDWFGEQLSAEIISTDGIITQREAFIPENENQLNIDINSLKPGIYLMRITHQQGYTSLRFIKQ
jgi:hypothetical protein